MSMEVRKKAPSETRNVPQGLKPTAKSACGTAEAVPLSKTGFFCSLYSRFWKG
jgi:hypothetical protein